MNIKIMTYISTYLTCRHWKCP